MLAQLVDTWTSCSTQNWEGSRTSGRDTGIRLVTEVVNFLRVTHGTCIQQQEGFQEALLQIELHTKGSKAHSPVGQKCGDQIL